MIGNITPSVYISENSSAAATGSTGASGVKESPKPQSVAGLSISDPDQNQSVKVTISEEARAILGLSKENKTQEQAQNKSENQNSDTYSPQEEYTTGELKEIAELKSTDREVRAHEMAHVMAGGTLVRRGASYSYKQGPDGIRYAVAGEVSIDSSPVEGDPSATIRKMQQVRRAAEAPAEPSSQDRAVAASAARNEAEARQELMAQTPPSTTSEE